MPIRNIKKEASKNLYEYLKTNDVLPQERPSYQDARNALSAKMNEANTSLDSNEEKSYKLLMGYRTLFLIHQARPKPFFLNFVGLYRYYKENSKLNDARLQLLSMGMKEETIESAKATSVDNVYKNELLSQGREIDGVEYTDEEKERLNNLEEGNMELDSVSVSGDEIDKEVSTRKHEMDTNAAIRGRNNANDAELRKRLDVDVFTEMDDIYENVEYEADPKVYEAEEEKKFEEDLPKILVQEALEKKLEGVNLMNYVSGKYDAYFQSKNNDPSFHKEFTRNEINTMTMEVEDELQDELDKKGIDVDVFDGYKQDEPKKVKITIDDNYIENEAAKERGRHEMEVQKKNPFVYNPDSDLTRKQQIEQYRKENDIVGANELDEDGYSVVDNDIFGKSEIKNNMNNDEEIELNSKDAEEYIASK